MDRSFTACLSALALAALIAAGCRPAMPTEAEARAAFAERRPVIERMEDAVFTFMAISGPAQFDDAAVGRIAEVGGALGLRLEGLGTAPPCIGGEAHENVAPANGFADDRYRVGWGLYQTAWEQAGVKHGDGAFHPGIVVTWQLGEGAPMKSEATACFLLDGTPRPP